MNVRLSTILFLSFLSSFVLSTNASAYEIGDKGKRLIRTFEGMALCPYKDPVGYWTIGVGHLMTSRESKTTCLTPMQVEEIFTNDLIPVNRCVTKQVRRKINSNQVDALGSFVFNVGCGKLMTSTLLKKVNQNPSDKAIEAQFVKWVYAKRTKLRGLVLRREAEARLYFSD
jgi:lysozyme